MAFINTKVHENVPAHPFLRATRDGIDLDGKTSAKLIVKITDACDIKKLFVEGGPVQTYRDGECSDPKARAYLRLTLDVEGATYLMDLPPKVAARLVQLDTQLAADGKALNEVPLRLTTVAKSAKGMDWAEAVFAVAADGEMSTEAKDPGVF